MVELKLQQFSGPLDLLLSLIEDQKLPITELSLSTVTEQYLDYLNTLEDDRPDEVADFLVIASKLLLMKAKALLPHFLPEEEEGKSLEEQLRLYKKFVEASRFLSKRWVGMQHSFFREEPVRKVEGFVPPQNVNMKTVHKAITQIIARLKPPKPLPELSLDKRVSIKEVIENLRNMLKQHKEFSFHKSLGEKQNKTELIIGFLALLELVKLKTVHLDQQSHFGDIIVRRI
jgi:segregation and condensation protein A